MIILHCKSIPNLRDFGNTVTADGRRIRKDCLLRSAHLGNASEEDIRYLQREHRLRTVIDLRTGGEREEEPDRAGSCLVLNIPIIESFEAGITHESTTENMPFPDLATLYRKIVQDKGCQMGFRKVLRACFENDYESGSVLWHCSEGKDRCGLTAAILLEAIAGESGESFPLCFIPDEKERGLLRFDWRPMIRALAAQRQAGTAAPTLAAKFMNTLIEMAAEQAAEAAEKTGIRQVVLSGGSFQNQYVMRRLPSRLQARGLEVYHHRRVSCNDEGLSLGQLMIGNAREG